MRIHLDPSTVENGAMEISLGSHRLGKVPAREAAQQARAFPQETCVTKRGDVLVLKMLTLHRSSPASDTSGRRTYRVDFAPDDLPPPLSWA